MSLRRLVFCVFVFCIAVALLPSTAAASTASGSVPGLTSSSQRTLAAAFCPTCGGLGQLLCPACGGAGTYFIIGYGGYMELWPCSVCVMTGRIRCYTCLGTGLAPSAPYMVMNPTSMSFSATVAGSNPFSQALTVRRSDNGQWWTRISAPAAWAQVSFNAGIFYVSPQTAGLAPGTYTTNVSVEMWSDRENGTPVQGSPLQVPVTFVVNPAGTVASPTFSPNGGTFNSAQTVTIACQTAGATIRYTTDGSDPTVSSTLYSGPINVSDSGTLKARGYKTNWTGSTAAQSAPFTISIPRTIVPTAGSGGSISPNTPQTVNSGASKNFTITPAAGYRVVDVLVDGNSVGAVTSYSFTNVGKDHTISATFAANTAAPVKLPTTIKLSGPSTVKVRRTLRLTGTVVPSAATGTVTIVKTRLVGKTWKSAGSARVNITSGSYRYSFKPTKKGRWRFVAKYSGAVIGTTTYTASKSGTRSVRVK